MITYEKALEIAKEHFSCVPDRSITKVYDSEAFWIVFAAIKDRPQYTSTGISISKDSGEVKRFILPSKENFRILHSANLIEQTQGDA